MKRLTFALVSLLVTMSMPWNDASAAAKRHYTYQGGHYAGGQGGSHKGGTYVNRRTGNHYTHHQ